MQSSKQPTTFSDLVSSFTAAYNQPNDGSIWQKSMEEINALVDVTAKRLDEANSLTDVAAKKSAAAKAAAEYEMYIKFRLLFASYLLDLDLNPQKTAVTQQLSTDKSSLPDIMSAKNDTERAQLKKEYESAFQDTLKALAFTEQEGAAFLLHQYKSAFNDMLLENDAQKKAYLKMKYDVIFNVMLSTKNEKEKANLQAANSVISQYLNTAQLSKEREEKVQEKKDEVANPNDDYPINMEDWLDGTYRNTNKLFSPAPPKPVNPKQLYGGYIPPLVASHRIPYREESETEPLFDTSSDVSHKEMSSLYSAACAEQRSIFAAFQDTYKKICEKYQYNAAPLLEKVAALQPATVRNLFTLVQNEAEHDNGIARHSLQLAQEYHRNLTDLKVDVSSHHQDFAKFRDAFLTTNGDRLKTRSTGILWLQSMRDITALRNDDEEHTYSKNKEQIHKFELLFACYVLCVDPKDARTFSKASFEKMTHGKSPTEVYELSLAYESLQKWQAQWSLYDQGKYGSLDTPLISAKEITGFYATLRTKQDACLNAFETICRTICVGSGHDHKALLEKFKTARTTQGVSVLLGDLSGEDKIIASKSLVLAIQHYQKGLSREKNPALFKSMRDQVSASSHGLFGLISQVTANQKMVRELAKPQQQVGNKKSIS